MNDGGISRDLNIFCTATVIELASYRNSNCFILQWNSEFRFQIAVSNLDKKTIISTPIRCKFLNYLGSEQNYNVFIGKNANFQGLWELNKYKAWLRDKFTLI